MSGSLDGVWAPDGVWVAGGHLLEGRVFPTLEAIVTETPARLRKVMHPDLGVALIDLDQSES